MGRKLSYFMQVNFANEKQKLGLSVSDVPSFFEYCKNKIDLNIVGTMCFPPFETDPEIFNAIHSELVRQQNHIELIASENIVSKAVLDAQGSIMTNKYAEGLPNRRYYGGCEHVDTVENLARQRARPRVTGGRAEGAHKALARDVPHLD